MYSNLYIIYLFIYSSQRLISCRVQFELWDSDDVPVPRSELLQKVRGMDALLCVLTEKIDTELLDAAGQVIVLVVHVNVLSLTQCKGPPLMCV